MDSTKAPPCNPSSCACSPSFSRRDFLRWTAVTAGLAFAPWPSIAGPFSQEDFQTLVPADKKLDAGWVKSLRERGRPQHYAGPELEKIGMPVGGICAGQLYLGGDGRLWHWDIFNLPQAWNFVNTGGPNYAKPPKPASPIEQGFAVKIETGNRVHVRPLDSRGFDAKNISFRGEYPIGRVQYSDPSLPLSIQLEAFSPFIPLNVDDSSLPLTVMHFTVQNTGGEPMAVEIAGWIENAVCMGSGRPGLGQRRNRSVVNPDLIIVHCTAEPLPKDRLAVPRPEIVFETFEDGYKKWQPQGVAFGPEPAQGTLPNQQQVSGFEGKRLVNTYLDGDKTRGKLTSAPFTIVRRYIAFLIGGGSHANRTCMNLVVDGNAVRGAAGKDNERLEWQDWEVGDLEGKIARLEIVDEATEGWGHINVDQIVFTDEPPSARVPLDHREDFGSMALGVLKSEGIPFSNVQVSAPIAEQVFETGATEEAVAPFGQKLVGAIGQKLNLAPGAKGEVTFLIAWFFPGLLRSALGPLHDLELLRRSYSNRFKSAAEVLQFASANFHRLSTETRLWRDTWYDSTLPYWFLDRTFAPICTLATSTCYQFNTGRFYAFEGVYCCQGTCQHVWNYAQSVARIFPQLERDLRQRTDFGSAWHQDGATDYRGECARHVAHDGQCGIILRVWREHLMSADNKFLLSIWPRVRQSLDYLVGQDEHENGLLEGEQYNTLDAAWFGPMAWISSFYIAPLRAGEAMALEIGDTAFATRCRKIAERGSDQLVRSLYNGEYFIHKPDLNRPKATNTNDGCHIDQLMGQAWALQAGLPRISPMRETLSALEAIWKYNFTPDVGPFREHSYIKGGRWYAMAGEGGVIMTTFPRGGVEKATGDGGFGYYFNEVWTGQEHQLAAHMLWEGLLDYGLVITRTVHDRHHALRRNPYNEVECSDHYTRAMSSHGTFIAACGYEYHGPKGHIGFAPRLSPDNFRAPFTAAEGWGTFEQTRENGKQAHTLRLRYGTLRLTSLSLTFAEEIKPSTVQVILNGTPHEASLQASGSRALVMLARPITIRSGENMKVTLS